MELKNMYSDYIWQLENSIISIDDLPKNKLSAKEWNALNKLPNKKIVITPYMFSLINFDDYNCPIRKQIIPSEHKEYFQLDYLNESEHLKTPLIVQKNQNRVLFLVSKRCAFNCTFCTRSRLQDVTICPELIDKSIEYISNTCQINEVIVSGGDPLLLSNQQLYDILNRLKNIPHISVVRIGTRIPISLPMRIDSDLIDILKEFSPIYMNVHINHPKEITESTIDCFNKLANAGVVLGSQTVLLKNINDDYDTLRELYTLLICNRVRPYYLFQCDMEKGCEDFVVDQSRGVQLINRLQKSISGLAVPKYILDTPKTKVVLGPK